MIEVARGADVAFTNHSATEDEEDEDGETMVEDMASSQVAHIVDETLAADAGLNRFPWNMNHKGPWHEEEDKRFTEGPLAAPGEYTARLIVGDRVVEQGFRLQIDPRVEDDGTSIDDVRAQVTLQLQLVTMLDDARQLEHRLSEEREKLEQKRDSGDLTDAERSRVAQLEAVLTELKTAEIIYPQPMLTGQIEYLYEMLGNADQAPGQEAEDRYRDLSRQFAELKSKL